jgi:hypothetical protein
MVKAALAPGCFATGLILFSFFRCMMTSVNWGYD